MVYIRELYTELERFSWSRPVTASLFVHWSSFLFQFVILALKMRLARREVVSTAVVACKDNYQILKSLVSALTFGVQYFFSIKLSVSIYIYTTVRSGSWFWLAKGLFQPCDILLISHGIYFIICITLLDLYWQHFSQRQWRISKHRIILQILLLLCLDLN